MTVILATGNAMLDDHIKRFVESSKKVNYLEEIKETIEGTENLETTLLSSFLPSAHDETEEGQMKSFQEIVKLLLNKEIRIVFLTDSELPIESLNELFDLGVYDFIVSQDGNVSIDEITRKN